MAIPVAAALGKPLRRVTSAGSARAAHRLRTATRTPIAQDPNLHAAALEAAFQAQDAIRNIKRESDFPYWILIFSSLFVTFIGFISFIPVVGWGFYMVLKLCTMILGIMVISYANQMSHAKSHGRLYTRIVILALAMLFGFLFPPLNAALLNAPALLTEAWILLGARRDRKKKITQLKKTSTLAA